MALECCVLALFLCYPSFLGEAASCEDSVTREQQQHDFECSTGTGDLVWACAIGSLVSAFTLPECTQVQLYIICTLPATLLPQQPRLGNYYFHKNICPMGLDFRGK